MQRMADRLGNVAKDMGGNMFGSGHDIASMKRLARALTALAFLIANVSPSYAQGLAGSGFPQRGAASFAGHAAMLGVRIPFGGEEVGSQPIVGLMFGSSWRAGPGSMGPQAHRFTPTIEAGLSLRGDPVLRLSSFEVRLDQLHAAPEDAQGETFCRRNPGLCIAGVTAVAAAVVVVVLAAGSESCEAPLPDWQYPPGEHPCRCYEADGC
jgi:hypothetical protein